MEQQAHSRRELCSLKVAGILKAVGWEKKCEHVQVSFAGSRVAICLNAALLLDSPAFVHAQDDGVINIQLHTLIGHPHLHLPLWTLVGKWLRRGKIFSSNSYEWLPRCQRDHQACRSPMVRLSSRVLAVGIGDPEFIFSWTRSNRCYRIWISCPFRPIVRETMDNMSS